ncbi:MAG: hypothetical protein ACJ74W_02500 [Pyrinomonadaceae bacterium]
MADPVKTFAALNDIAARYARLKALAESNKLTDADKNATVELLGLINDLRNSLDSAGNKLETARDNWNKPSIRADAITQMANVLDFTAAGGGQGSGTGSGTSGGAPAPVDGDGVELKHFIADISTSLIGAQTALNQASLDYVSALDARIPPAYYGIPTVRAEMKIGIEQVKEKRVNLILLNNSAKRREYAESIVSFEIVGAPPPPGPTVFGHYVVPLPRFLVTGDKRQRLLQEIGKLLDGTQFGNGQASAIVLRYELGAAETLRYLVLWPGFNINEVLPQWRALAMIYVLEDRNGALTLPGTQKDSIFEVPAANGIFQINKSTPESLAKPIMDLLPASIPQSTKDKIQAATVDLANKVVNFGDVVANTLTIVDIWLAAVTYHAGQPLAPPGE